MIALRGCSQLAQWERTHLQGRRHRFDTWVRKIPWRKKWQSIPGCLPGQSHGQKSLAVIAHGVAKGWTHCVTKHTHAQMITCDSLTLVTQLWNWHELPCAPWPHLFVMLNMWCWSQGTWGSSRDISAFKSITYAERDSQSTWLNSTYP